MVLSLVSTLDSPGPAPAGLAWDGQYLWNADFQAGKLFCIEPESGKTVDSLWCPGVLSGLAWDGNSLWQAIMDEGWLRNINPTTHDFDRHLIVEDAARLSGVAWDGKHFWVLSQRRGKLLALDPRRGDVQQTIDVPVAAGGLTYRQNALWVGVPLRMRFDAQENVFVWDSAEHRYVLLQISIAQGKEVGRIPVDFLPMGLAWAGDRLWLSHTRERKLLCAHLS